MTIIADHATFIVTTYRDEPWIPDQPAMRTMSEALDYIHDNIGADNPAQVIEFNPFEGYCRDVTEDAFRAMLDQWPKCRLNTHEPKFENGVIVWQEIEEREYRDPDAEHRLSASQLGIGRGRYW